MDSREIRRNICLLHSTPEIKPIDKVNENLKSVRVNINKLENDILELKQINRNIIDILNKYFENERLNKEYIKIEKESKKGWFY